MSARSGTWRTAAGSTDPEVRGNRSSSSLTPTPTAGRCSEAPHAITAGWVWCSHGDGCHEPGPAATSTPTLHERMSGTPCFKGTRVPVQCLIDYIEGNSTLEEFFEDYPSVSRQQVTRFLELAKEQLVECESS